MSTELRARLLSEFSGRAHPYPTSKTILQLFEEWALRSPDSPALTFGDTTLSYRALDQRANTLAETLRGRGIGKGDFVPLVMRNGLDLPVSVVALMKLGAPFVPIDDLWPTDRLASMIDNVRAKVVLHDAEARNESLPETLGIEIDARSLAEREWHERGEPAGMADLIYGFYTSGTTGEPKCALNVHRGLLNRFLYMTRAFGGRADEVVLQNSRHVFDSSIWQMLWPLTNGARVVVPRRSGVLDLSVTIDTIHQHGVTMTDFVPSIFNTLVDLITAEPELARRLTTLRTLLIGGEEINVGAVQRFRSMLPDVRIVNTYGPTECSIGSVFHPVGDADHASIPLGKPIDNTYIVILDENGDLVSPGAVGEIHIAGDCLGLGYLNDPERSAEVLVRNPFTEIPGDRLYRTGDLGSWRDDGHLVFAGRTDQQIKIGGVRVELSEIEMALQTHPRVRDAKVIAHGEFDAKTLIAFLRCDSGITETALRAHARSALPPYLVPKRFLVIDRMPLTPNGKADRVALAKMADTRVGAITSLDDIAGTVQEIWHTLLPGVEIGADDKFFDVGGDSLRAQRLALALNKRFGTRLTVRDVVQCETIAAQVRLIRGEHDSAAVYESMSRDARLPADIWPRAAGQTRPFRDILLTGATGFVGGQLLHDLLRDTDGVVHCLVRADERQGAHARIRANLRELRLWNPDFAHRVIAVPGDLGAPLLGLRPDQYQELADQVDVVLHNGAMVNLVRDYAAHKASNVDGTAEILRLACTGRTKPVHFISTLSTLPNGGAEAPAPRRTRPADGYSQSKLVAEWLVDAAAERGLPTAVYRLGEIMPNTRLGVASRDGLADQLIRAGLRLGASFRSGITLDYLPVDRVSALVVAAMVRSETGYFHLRQRELTRLDDVLDAFRKHFDLADVSYQDFLTRLRSAAENDRDLGKALTMLPTAEIALPELFSQLADRPAERAERVARRAGIEWDPASPAVFERYARSARQRFEISSNAGQTDQVGPNTADLAQDRGEAAPITATIRAPAADTGMTVWLTGLPSSGKSTIARGVARRLSDAGHRVAVLDGDEIRRNLTSDLGFSRADREENVRRIGYVAQLLSTQGVITLVPVIAPYIDSRKRLRIQHLSDGIDFAEVYVAAPVEVCGERDVKGLYAKQREGELAGLTGVDDPYEPPTAADLVVPTHTQAIDESVDAVHALVVSRAWP